LATVISRKSQGGNQPPNCLRKLLLTKDEARRRNECATVTFSYRKSNFCLSVSRAQTGERAVARLEYEQIHGRKYRNAMCHQLWEQSSATMQNTDDLARKAVCDLYDNCANAISCDTRQ
jgi:hypothetical protein